MNFQKWLNVQEMASFSVSAAEKAAIPCGRVRGLPCKDAIIGAIDMRFEGPPAYDPPFNKFNNGSKFIAKLPSSSNYLVYHGGMQPVEVIDAKEATNLNYPEVPEYWYERAEVMDTNYNVIKPALGDFTGERQKFLSGEQ